MPETAVRTKDQIAVTAIQDILKQEDYNPKFLKDLIKACQTANQTLPSPEAIIINGKPYPVRSIREHLAKFVYMLPPENRPAFNDESLYDDSFLENLSGIIDQVSGFTPTQQSASIPPNLKALVEQFEKANQAAISAQSKRQGWSPEEFRKQIAFQDQITVQMHQVRQYALSQLEWAITNSTALENLAASLGVRPQDVKNLALQRAKTSVDKNITALTFRQARALITDPVQLAAYYTARLKADVMADDLLILAAVDKGPKTKQKYLDTALKKTKEVAAAETETAKPAIAAAAENLAQHPSVQKAAQADAIAAVKQVETVSLSRPPNQQLPPAKAARLNQQLVRHQDNPSVQEKIIANVFGVSAAQSKIIRGQLAPQINQLAASTQRFNPLLAADTTGILADALRNPNRFPKPFVDAIKSGKISDNQIAAIIQTANLLGVPVSAVTFSYFGVESSQVKTNLTRGRGALPADHPTIVTLSHLASAQVEINKARQQNLLPASLEKDLESSIRHYTRAIRWNKFTESINPFRLFTGIGARLNEIPQFSGTLSGFRVQSGPIDSVFNFIGSLGNTTRSLPGFITRPFAAVGNAIGNTIINPVKTWANTQIKSGLARAGAWLAKKGVTKAAQKIGGAVLGKAAAGLLGAAVGGPVGWVAGALTLLSALGDIGKFLWQNRKTIGLTLGGLFFLGNMLLGKLFAAISGLTNILGFAGLGAGIGFFLGGPVGALVGGAIGGLIGWGISAAGGLGAALSGLGTALGSAAAGLSSFIGALTAPSAFIGLGSTIATAGLLGVGLAWAIQTFFIQPNINSALFVPPDSGTFPPGGPPSNFPAGLAGKCPEGGEEITQDLASRITNGAVKLLPNSIPERHPDRHLCITPTTIIMHWSGGTNDNPDGNIKTYDTLVTRVRIDEFGNPTGEFGLACQMGTDTNDTELWQPFYETQVEMSSCAGGVANTTSINNEMAGVSFTDSPPPPNLNELELTYDAMIVIMKQYGIPWCQIYGHYDVSADKSDPGREFLLNVFIPEIKNRYPDDPENICS